MQEFTCLSCRQVLRSRLRQRLSQLQDGRRRFHSPVLQGHGQSAESWYWETKPPTLQELAAAEYFFKHNRPFRQWTGDGWRQQGGQTGNLLVPEVIVLGRSNVGKSSLINALAGEDLNRASSTPGATTTMAAWAFAAKKVDGGAIPGWDGDVSSKLCLVDMPGYGFGSRSQWSDAIMSYLIKRKNIRRAFVLLDAIHGVGAGDRHMIEVLRGLAIPYQIIATKCDRLIVHKSYQSEVRQALTNLRSQVQLDTQKEQELGLGEIISVGNLQAATLRGKPPLKTNNIPFGVQNLQWAILRATGLDSYVVQKAQAHGVLKNISAKEQPTLNIDGSTIRGISGPHSPEVESQAMDRKQEDANETTSTRAGDMRSSSTLSLPELSIEDFIREIVNAKPASSSSPRIAKSLPPSHKPARTAPEPIDDSPYEPVFRLNSPNATRSPTAGAEKSQSARRVATYQDNNNTSRKQTAHFREAESPGVKSHASTRDSRTAYQNAVPGSKPSETRASPSQTPTAGKGVIRGIDAFESLMAPPKPRTQSRSQSKSMSPARKQGQRNGEQARSTTPGREQAKSTPQPALTGKGVLRGMDAFAAMGADDNHKKSSRRRSRR
jgi:GTP-binding protein